MKVIKLKFYQPFACYSLPFSFGVVNTYFLPPPSTIKGFVHSTAGAQKDYPMAISIHGKFKAITYELQQIIKFDQKRENQPLLKGFGRYSLKERAIRYVELLTEVNLTLYLYFPPESSPLKEAFLKNLLIKEFPSLGRKEDIALLTEEPKEVELQPFKDEAVLEEFTYFKKETAKELYLTGSIYRLPLSYDGELSKKLGWRYFKKEDFLLAPPLQPLEPLVDGLFFDPDEERVIELIALPEGYRHVLGQEV